MRRTTEEYALGWMEFLPEILLTTANLDEFCKSGRVLLTVAISWLAL